MDLIDLYTGWWLEHEWMMTFHRLGMSSSQLTKSIIFQRGGLKPPTRYIWRRLINFSEGSFFCATELGHFIYASMMLAFHNAMFCLVNSYGNPWVSCERTSMVDFPIIVVFCTSTGGYINICNIHHLATSTRNSIHVWRGHLISSMMPNGLV